MATILLVETFVTTSIILNGPYFLGQSLAEPFGIKFDGLLSQTRSPILNVGGFVLRELAYFL